MSLDHMKTTRTHCQGVKADILPDAAQKIVKAVKG